MMKKLLHLFLLAFTSISFAQTTTLEFTTSATTKLVISQNGFFLDETAPGEYTPATITVTSTTDFSGTTEPTYGNLFLPLKDPSNSNVFGKNGNLKSNNTTSPITTVNDVTTRVWEYSKLDVLANAPIGTGYYQRLSGTAHSGGSITNVPATITNPGYPIEVVANYYAPGYVELLSVDETFASVERGAEFTVNFNYTANTNIEGLVFELWIRNSNESPVVQKQLAILNASEITVTGTEENMTGSVNLTFPSDASVTKENYTFNIVPTASLQAGEDYQFRVRSTGNDSTQTFSSGDNVLFYNGLTFTTIEESTLGLKDVNGNEVSVYPNPTTGIINISDISNIQNIKVSNILGQVVKNVKASKTIDISDLPQGIYLLQTGNQLIQKIIKN